MTEKRRIWIAGLSGWVGVAGAATVWAVAGGVAAFIAAAFPAAAIGWPAHYFGAAGAGVGFAAVLRRCNSLVVAVSSSELRFGLRPQQVCAVRRDAVVALVSQTHGGVDWLDIRDSSNASIGTTRAPLQSDEQLAEIARHLGAERRWESHATLHGPLRSGRLRVQVDLTLPPNAATEVGIVKIDGRDRYEAVLIERSIRAEEVRREVVVELEDATEALLVVVAADRPWPRIRAVEVL